jgi:hypothetical protein
MLSKTVINQVALAFPFGLSKWSFSFTYYGSQRIIDALIAYTLVWSWTAATPDLWVLLKTGWTLGPLALLFELPTFFIPCTGLLSGPDTFLKISRRNIKWSIVQMIIECNKNNNILTHIQSINIPSSEKQKQIENVGDFCGNYTLSTQTTLEQNRSLFPLLVMLVLPIYFKVNFQ